MRALLLAISAPLVAALRAGRSPPRQPGLTAAGLAAWRDAGKNSPARKKKAQGKEEPAGDSGCLLGEDMHTKLMNLQLESLYPVFARNMEDNPFSRIQMLQFYKQFGFCVERVAFAPTDGYEYGYALFPCDAAAVNGNHVDSHDEFSPFNTIDRSAVCGAGSSIERMYWVAGGNAMFSTDTLSLFQSLFQDESSLEAYKNLNVLAFFTDFPGYGENGGEPSPSSSLASNLEAFADWKKCLGKEPPIDFIGHSLGSAQVLLLAAQPEVASSVDRVVVSAPFANEFEMARALANNMAGGALDWLPGFSQATDAVLKSCVAEYWDNLSEVAKLPANTRLIVIASPQDNIVPSCQSYDVANTAKNVVNSTFFLDLPDAEMDASQHPHNSFFIHHVPDWHDVLTDKFPRPFPNLNGLAEGSAVWNRCIGNAERMRNFIAEKWSGFKNFFGLVRRK